MVTFALAGSLASGDVAAPGLGDLNWAAAEALTELAEAARARGERLPPHFPPAADADLSDHVEFVLGRIGGLVRAQRNLRDFRLLPADPASGERKPYAPLLSQIVARVCREDLAEEESEDILHSASMLGGLLNAGLGRLGMGALKAKPQPSDHGLLFVFVIGGITLAEATEVREAFHRGRQSGSAMSDLFVGGTELLTPDGLFEALFAPGPPRRSGAEDRGAPPAAAQAARPTPGGNEEAEEAEAEAEEEEEEEAAEGADGWGDNDDGWGDDDGWGSAAPKEKASASGPRTTPTAAPPPKPAEGGDGWEGENDGWGSDSSW